MSKSALGLFGPDLLFFGARYIERRLTKLRRSLNEANHIDYKTVLALKHKTSSQKTCALETYVKRNFATLQISLSPIIRGFIYS